MLLMQLEVKMVEMKLPLRLVQAKVILLQVKVVKVLCLVVQGKVKRVHLQTDVGVSIKFKVMVVHLQVKV